MSFISKFGTKRTKKTFLKSPKSLDRFLIGSCLSILLVPQINDSLSAIVQMAILAGRISASVKPSNTSDFSEDQRWVISEYLRAGRDLGASNHEIITALTITAQESGYRSLIPGKTCNLDRGECNDDWFFASYGERSDSFGTRQGRLSSGYDKSCMLDPYCSAKTIYQEFNQIPNADNLSVWQLAAKVQKPAKEYEYHYQAHESEAESILKAEKKSKPEKSIDLTFLPWISEVFVTFIPPIKAPISSGFGFRKHPITGEIKPHNGIDYAAALGTPIQSSMTGTVIFSGDEDDGFGNKIIIQNGKYKILYAHLSEILVTKNSRIKQGDIIGKVGSTGLSTGSHLHFEIWENDKPIDPTTKFSN